ncbi:hypothetical protein HG530_001140 [Fusarium avenaceum]|nr:hypothetical protein HG530_001140 [Fusarium avenaceum]
MAGATAEMTAAEPGSCPDMAAVSALLKMRSSRRTKAFLMASSTISLELVGVRPRTHSTNALGHLEVPIILNWVVTTQTRKVDTSLDARIPIEDENIFHSAVGNLLLLILPVAVLLHLFIDLELGITRKALAVKLVHVHITVVLELVLVFIVVLLAILGFGSLLALHILLLLLLSGVLLLATLLPSLLEVFDLILALVHVLVPHDLATSEAFLNLGQAKAHSGT